MKTVQTSFRRRLALLASSSLGALSIMVCAGGAAALLPSTALAADECGVQAADGDPVVCPAGTYPAGISYTGGTIPLTLQDAVIVTDGGLNVDASTAISIGAQNLVPGGAPQITNSTGAGISLTSGGSIDMNLWSWDIDGSDGFVTGTSGVVISSVGATNVAAYADIPITATDPNGVGASITTGAGYNGFSWAGSISSAGTGVEANVTDGYLSLNLGAVTAAGNGIVGSALGTGSMFVSAGPITAGGVGISVTTESGDATVNMNGDITAGSGTAVRISSGGSATLGVGSGTTLRAGEFDIAAANNVGFTVVGALLSATGDASDMVIDQSAASVSVGVLEGGLLVGAVDFSGIANGATIDLGYGGTWHLGGYSVLSSSTDTLNNNGSNYGSTPGTIVAEPGTVLDFSGGNDTFTNRGRLLFSGSFTLANLEAFNNSEVIQFGSSDGQTTNGAPGDRLVADGAAFTGETYRPGGSADKIQSTFVFDVNFAGAQSNCSTASVADCLSLVGGSTAGETLVRINRVGTAPATLGTRIVLVDVAGGTSAAEHFVLDRTTPGYMNSEVLGPGFDFGPLYVRFTYDAAAQQHVLVAAPDVEAYQMAVLPTAAQTLWHTSVGAWEDRTAGLVDSLAAGEGGGPATWIKYVRSRHDRDMESDFIGANPGFETSYRQDTDTVIGGVDLLRGGGEGEAYVLGLTLGHVNSDVTFDESLTRSNFKGMTYGAYASYLTDAFFVDGVVQVNRLDYDNAQSNELAKGSLTSTGAQVEAGLRIPISDGAAHIEPLASLAYVRTKFDELAYSNATFAPEDATSLRGSIGARIAGGVQFRPLTIRGSLTGRVWDEFKGDNSARLVSGGASAPLEDDFSGAFGDVGVGLSVSTPDDRISGLLSTNVKFKKDFFSSDASIGLRMSW